MQLRDVEDFYPLSPLQQGLLFHNLSEPESGMYFNQTLATLRGDLDVEAFRQAWQRVVDLHPILRSFFVWEGVEESIQVVRPKAEMELETEDWTALSAEEQAGRLDALRESDLKRGFDLRRAPLMRAVLAKTATGSHELLWSFHHILMDGWSMFHVLGQVFGSYDALCSGGELALTPSAPFRNHIVWLRRQDAKRAEQFWRKSLAGFEAPTPLPVETGRGETVPDGGAGFDSLTAYVPAATTETLQELCRQQHLTLNTVLQGAWALLLSRCSGRDDVLFGTIVSGRPADLEGVESMVGLFINTLPVRVRVPEEPALLDWLQELQVDLAELREFEYSSLAEVQSWSDVPGGTQLFESLFLFENYKKDSSIEEMTQTLELCDIRWFERHNFPIAALSIPGPELMLRIIYQTDRFGAASIERMLGHWRTLLEQIAAAPRTPLGELSLLTEDEREQLLVHWNATQAELPDATAHALFEAQVDRTPDAVAVVGSGRTLTYRELDERANRWAAHLRERGVAPGELVAICTERTPEMVVGILATLKAGGAYVPLDTGLPAQRIAYMIEDSGARLVLTRSAMADSLPETDAEQLAIDSDWDAPDARSGERLATTTTGATPRDLAYVIYTSGSTGMPKGVELEHAGLVNLITWHQRAYDVKPADRATHLAGLGFDASVWELWPYLTAGSSLYLVDDETRLVPESLLAFFAEHGITQTFLPTPMAEAILREEVPADLPLEVVLAGGDKLNRAPDRELPFRLYNQYGPTENTVVATAIEVPPAPDDDSAPSIGFPIQNVRCYLLDPAGRPVPVGVAGELFIGGASLARGYRGQPDLTAEKFAPSPFDPDERLYATGDQARWRADGQIDFLGRGDDQVKLRGYRIELGEIEVTLGRHPAVLECVVLAREDEPGRKQLVAYVVAGDGAELSVSELRDFLREQLPDYMVPTAFVVLERFPLSGSGKVDRRALPAPEAGSLAPEAAYVEPTADVERTIAGIWQDVLKVERVGLHDNFFDLGGHSLLLIRVHGKLKQALERDLPIVDLFQYPTVNTLARHLEGAGTQQAAEPEDRSEKLEAGRARLQQLKKRRRK